MIETVLWYLGNVETNAVMVTRDNVFYGEKHQNFTEYDAIWTGKIGLMYASDYAFAISDKDCRRSADLRRNDVTNVCDSKNWIYEAGNEWTISVSLSTFNNKTTGYTISIADRGGLDTSDYNTQDVRPVLYLKSNVYFTGGTGSAVDPYILGMK